MTNPTDITGQFLTGDSIAYQCNNPLIPNAPTTLTCTDTGETTSLWLPDVTTTPLPTCSKYDINSDVVFLINNKLV